jgi:hypothetical protein
MDRREPHEALIIFLVAGVDIGNLTWSQPRIEDLVDLPSIRVELS